LRGSLTFDVTTPSPRSVNVVAMYTCEVGYQLASVNTQRTCQASGIWNGAAPTCTKSACPLTYHQVCHNCDIVDSACPHDIKPAIFDDCRLAAISKKSMFVEHDSSGCKTFSCQVPRITYTPGSVSIMLSCNKGFDLFIQYYSIF